MVTLGEVTNKRVTQKFNDKVDGYVINGHVTYNKNGHIDDASGQIEAVDGGHYADFNVQNGGLWMNVNASAENHLRASEIVTTVFLGLKEVVSALAQQ